MLARSRHISSELQSSAPRQRRFGPRRWQHDVNRGRSLDKCFYWSSLRAMGTALEPWGARHSPPVTASNRSLSDPQR